MPAIAERKFPKLAFSGGVRVGKSLGPVAIIREAEITVGTWVEACRLTRNVHPKDAPFVALTLHLGAKPWPHDAEMEEGLRAKGFDEFW